MPRIDDFKSSNKIFKKKDYRSWDVNLLEKLKLTSDNTPIKEQKSNETESSCEILPFHTGSIRVQLEPEQGSTEVQQGFNKSSNSALIGSNQNSIRVQADPVNRVQLGFADAFNVVRNLIAKLGGNEKKVFFYIVNICSLKGLLSTGNINGEELNQAISTTRNSRETALKRLTRKGLLKREKGKTGADGTLHLSISELIKTEALNYLSKHISEQEIMASWHSNRVQNGMINSAQLGFNPILYSSINTTTTTTKNIDLPENWLNIDIEPLRDIGFSETQLKQLLTKNLNTPEIVQDSIYHFAFGLQNNPKVKQYSDPLNVLMGVLRKGQGWVEQNYQSPQEIAQRQFLERKKAEKDRLKKLEEDAFKLALDEWLESISDDLKKMIIDTYKGSDAKMPVSTKLHLYYKQKFWPEKKNEYLMVQ